MQTPDTATTSRGQTEQVFEDYVYENVIPKLGPAREGDAHPSLLPLFGGQPGFIYYQCPVTRQRTAHQAGWKSVRNTVPYGIRGPNGQLDCVLLCEGEPITGSDLHANKRELLVDPDIMEITGLSVVTGFPKEEVIEEPEPEEVTIDATEPEQEIESDNSNPEEYENPSTDEFEGLGADIK